MKTVKDLIAKTVRHNLIKSNSSFKATETWSYVQHCTLFAILKAGKVALVVVARIEPAKVTTDDVFTRSSGFTVFNVV